MKRVPPSVQLKAEIDSTLQNGEVIVDSAEAPMVGFVGRLARYMLQVAIEAEASAFLGREHYRSAKEIEASGRDRVKVLELDRPVNTEASPTDPDFGDTFTDYVPDADRQLPDGTIVNAAYSSPDRGLDDRDSRRAVQVLLDGAVPPLTCDERTAFRLKRGLVDDIEHSNEEVAIAMNTSIVRVRNLTDAALKKIRHGITAVEVENLDRAAEWKIANGQRGRKETGGQS